MNIKRIFQHKTAPDELSPEERRKYIRLDTVFPVQFRLIYATASFSPWMQGYTDNISSGGICLSAYHLNSDIIQALLTKRYPIQIEIQHPRLGFAVEARTRIAWIKQPEIYACIIGLNYEEIDQKLNCLMVRFAWTKKIMGYCVLGAITLMIGLFLYTTLISIQLQAHNRYLMRKVKMISQEAASAQEKIRKAVDERSELDGFLKESQTEILELQKEKLFLEQELGGNNKSGMQAVRNAITQIDELTQQTNELKRQLASLVAKETTAQTDLEKLDQKQKVVQKEPIERMYRWLSVHQNSRTGLVASFEGDKDVKDWGFTYDQSLAAQAYLLSGDFKRAEKILDFFDSQAKRVEGRLLNAYYVFDGEPAEYIIHSGPNIWIGIAACQYTRFTKNTKFLSLAEHVAAGIIALQQQDGDGGIRGGPSVDWYSTEHNLDAYAFFNMLASLTGKSEYAQARDTTLKWLKEHTYDRQDLPVKRGKGDSTIATDTYAWSIAALGPRLLISIGMDPEKIMAFAQEQCAVSVSYQTSDGKPITVKGFDFSAGKNIARGGVVSSEWTAQMVVSFKIMSEYFGSIKDTSKRAEYAEKANEYLNQLNMLIISSASPSGQGDGCLPYATQESADTGHGWVTPKGKATGSVSATAYALFAYMGYNPLSLE